MTFKKGVIYPNQGKRGPGKVTALAKDAITKAAEGLGGAARLEAWARESADNERVFWGTIYPKLLPLQVTGEGGGPLVVELVRFSEVMVRDADSATE